MKKFLILIFCFSAGHFLYAQSLHFSQYEMFSQALNPALTGSMDADYRIAVIHRQQWKTLNTLFETTGLSAESVFSNVILPKNKLGAGFSFVNDNQGNGILQDLHLGGSLAYHHVFGANNRAQISFGVQGVFRQTQIDYASLQFSDQYEYFQFNPELATGESFDNENFGNFTFNGGVALQYKLSTTSVLEGGVALFNILKPVNSPFGLTEKTIAGMQFHTGINFMLSDRWATYPNLRVIYQGGSHNSMVGNEFAYLLSPEQNIKLYLGAAYRYQDAAIISGGMHWRDLKITGACDLTVSRLNDVKQALESDKGSGAFEIAMILELRKVKALSDPITVPCKIF